MKYPSLSVQLLTFVISLLLSARVCADSPLFQIRAVAESGEPDATAFTLRHKDSTESIPVAPAVWVDDNSIKSASVQTTAKGTPSIKLTLTETGTKRWAALTTKYTGKRLAILLQGKLVSAPTVSRPILGNTIEITSGFTESEAIELTKKLNANAPK